MSFNGNLIGTENYLVSFGDLRLQSDIAYKAFGTVIPTEPHVKDLIVTRFGADQDVVASCATGPQLSWHWAIVSRDCLSSAITRLTLHKPVRTINTVRGAAFLVQGWSTPEAWGTWSASKNAVIEFSVAGNSNSTNDYRLRVRYRPFILESWPVQKVTVVLNGKVNQEVVATTGEGEFSVGPFGAGRHVVELRIATARSPKSLGSSLDPRELGIGVTEIELIDAGVR